MVCDEFFCEEDLLKSFVTILTYTSHPEDGFILSSGCLIKYEGKHFLLTAGHILSVSNLKHELQLEQNNIEGDIKTFPLYSPWIIEDIDFTNNEHFSVDLAIFEIPIDKTPCIYPKQGNSYLKTIHEIDFSLQPEKGHRYMFSGLTNPKSGGMLPKFQQNFIDLQYTGQMIKELSSIDDDGTERRSAVYRFRLDMSSIRGEKFKSEDEFNNYFRGYSGTPIVNSQGKVMSILIGGLFDEHWIAKEMPDHMIYGLQLDRVGDILKGLSQQK